MKQSTGQREILGYGVFLMSVTHMFAHVYDRIFPALIPVFRDEFGLSLTELGVIASIPFFFQAILSIPSGYLTDKMGARRAIALSFLISISSAIAVAVSRGPLMLAISIAVLGIVTTFYHPASYTYTTKIASERNRSKALGLQSAGGPLGLALGPLSLTIIVGYFGWDWRMVYLFWIAPLVLILVAVLRMRTPREDTEKPKNEPVMEKPLTKSNGVRSLLTVGFVMFLVYSAVSSVGGQMISVFLPTYLRDVRMLSVFEASLVYGFISMVGVFAAPIGGYFADRVGTKRWLLYTLAGAILCLFLAYVSPSTILFVVFYFMDSFLTHSGMAASSAIIARLTPSAQRGMGYALSFLPGSIIGSVAPAFAGMLGERLGLSILFPIGIAAYLAALLVLKFGVKA
jgi:MFS family permease